MKAFVTGATGLLGSNLVGILSEDRHEVKALARSEEKARNVLGNTKCEIVVGDITALDRFQSLLKGCDVVFHAAAYFREYSGPGDHEEALRRINVDATLALIEACRRQGVKNVVFVSSNGATAVPADGGVQNEESGYDEHTDNLYFKSKIEAEKAIDRYLERQPEMRIVIIRPGLMIGPQDSGPTPAGQVILNSLNKKMPVILPCNIAVVDARDVARAMIAAATVGASGERFILGGRAYTMAQFAETLQDVSGVEGPKLRPSYPVAMILLSLASLASAVSGRAVPVRPRDLRRLHRLQSADSSKAQRCLNVRFTELSKSLKDAVAWYSAHARA